MLPKAFADEGFAFYGKALNGHRETARSMEARGRRDQRCARPCRRKDVCRRSTFRAESKAQLQTMVANISTAFDRRIDALTWMSPEDQGKVPRQKLPV